MDELRGWFLDAWPQLYLGGMFAAALLLGIGAFAWIVALAHAGRRWSDAGKCKAIVITLVASSVVSVLASGRVFYTDTELAAHPLLALSLAGESANSPGQVWISRLTVALALGIACSELFRWLIGERRMPPAARPLWVALVLYFLGSFVIAAAAGTVRDLHPMVLYMPLLLTAIALLAQDGVLQVLPALRIALWLVMLASLAAALLAPAMALERDYPSWLPGLHWRLIGVAEHANTLGALAALAMLLELSSLLRARPQLVVLLPALVVLVLAQSKTAWVEAFIGLFMVRVEYLRHRVFRGDGWAFGVGMAAAGTMLLALTVLALAWLSGSSRAIDFWESHQLATATGRTAIWSITMDEFMKSPLFGYGPALWDLQYRMEHGGLFYVGQAHNQYVQTLGQAGLVGAAALAGYVWQLLRGAARSWRLTQGLSGVVLMLLLVRSLTESPMRMGGIVGFDPLFHILAFALAALAPQSPAARADDRMAVPAPRLARGGAA